MKFNLPTREQCQEIVKKSEAFYCTETTIEGQKVEMLDYRLASISDFVDNDAFELRGLTFIYDENTDEWKRNILLNKFFNYSQTLGWMPDDLDNKVISRIQNKEDGSVISFVKFQNGKVRAKSKMSFTSQQAVMAQEIYDTNLNLRNALEYSFNTDSTLIFELTSPENQIVLEYSETKLILLQIRESTVGYYYDDILFNFYKKHYSLECTKDFSDYSLEDLLDMKKTLKGIEGWVVTFDDGQMCKIKTDQYLELHGLVGPDAFRENLLVQSILNNTIDDVISALVPGTKKDKIIDMTERVTHHFNHRVVMFKELRRKYFQDFKEDRKSFALEYRNEELFSGVMKTLFYNSEDIEQVSESQVKEHILKKCLHLNDAKKYLEGL